MAIRDKKFEILKIPLNCCQVNLNQKDSKGNSPLMMAIVEILNTTARTTNPTTSCLAVPAWSYNNNTSVQ